MIAGPTEPTSARQKPVPDPLLSFRMRMIPFHNQLSASMKLAPSRSKRVAATTGVAVAFFAFLSSSAYAEEIFKLGIGSDFDDKLDAAGKVFLNVVRAILFVLVIIAFVRFCVKKQYLDLGFVALGIALFGFSRKIVTALWTWGGNGA